MQGEKTSVVTFSCGLTIRYQRDSWFFTQQTFTGRLSCAGYSYKSKPHKYKAGSSSAFSSEERLVIRSQPGEDTRRRLGRFQGARKRRCHAPGVGDRAAGEARGLSREGDLNRALSWRPRTCLCTYFQLPIRLHLLI